MSKKNKNNKKKNIKNNIKKYINKIKKSKTKFTLSEMLSITVIAILIGILIGSSTAYSGDSITVTKIPEDLEEFITTYNNIKENYYDKVKEDKLIDSAIKGMVDSLEDPYTEYLQNNDSKTFNESVDGEYVGIGATVSYDGTTFTITEMFNNSPAKKAGLEVGDQLIEVSGKKTSDLDLEKVSDLIKGKSGSKVKIKVLRKEEEKEYTLKRSKITVPSVISEIFEKEDKKIGYISIDIFSSNTDKQFKKELKKLEKKKIDSLIIDVRSNPGGHLVQVTNILELFAKKNKVLYRIEKKGSVKKIKDSTKESRNYDIAVLINGASASASEILASTLRDVNGAILIGKTTYGKGTVQNAYQLSTGATLKYTTQKWLTSKGKLIDGKGITPHYEVDLDEKYYNEPITDNDNQLQKAIELLTEEKEEKSK